MTCTWTTRAQEVTTPRTMTTSTRAPAQVRTKPFSHSRSGRSARGVMMPFVLASDAGPFSDPFLRVPLTLSPSLSPGLFVPLSLSFSRSLRDCFVARTAVGKCANLTCLSFISSSSPLALSTFAALIRWSEVTRPVERVVKLQYEVTGERTAINRCSNTVYAPYSPGIYSIGPSN